MYDKYDEMFDADKKTILNKTNDFDMSRFVNLKDLEERCK